MNLTAFDLPDLPADHTMPHPSSCIWACTSDWSLQPLYLHNYVQSAGFLKSKFDS